MSLTAKLSDGGTSLRLNRRILLARGDVLVRLSVGPPSNHAGLVEIKSPPHILVSIISPDRNGDSLVGVFGRGYFESMIEHCQIP